MAKEIFATFDFTLNALPRIKDRLATYAAKLVLGNIFRLVRKKKKKIVTANRFVIGYKLRSKTQKGTVVTIVSSLFTTVKRI